MKENFWDSLKDFMAEELAKKERAEKSAARQNERIRKTLEAKAKEVIARYNQVCAELKPEAEERLRDVVIPWWNQEMIGSGFSEYLTRFLFDGVRKWGWNCVKITEPYFVFWPKELIEELQEPKFGRSKPFSWDAEGVISRLWGFDKNTPVEIRLQRELDKMDNSQLPADMLFKAGGSLEVYYARGRSGCGFRPERYTLPVDLINQKLPAINPSVIIDFAEQIENGQVEKVIERVIRAKQ